jgi:DNA repair protein RadC
MKKLSEDWVLSPHMAEVKVEYVTSIDSADRPKLCTPEEVHKYLRSIWNEKTIELHEEFYVLMFNNDLRLLGWNKVSMGGKSATIVEPSKIMVLTLLTNASSIVLAHNHPSGKLDASTSDIHLTKRIYEALQLVGISVNDHLILTKNSYTSFRNANLLPFSNRSS